MFKKRSKFLFIVVALESFLSLWLLFYFNYLDRLNYAQSVINTTNDLALLIQNMYTSTWWALIILVICLSTIFSLISLIYQELKFQLVAILLWFILFILAIDIKAQIGGVISILAIFMPIIAANIYAYLAQKKILIKKAKA